MVTVCVVCFIPILYAGVFLKSIWDPYGNMEDLPVAVVNEDQSVDFQGKTIAVGDELVKKLKNNDDLGWKFVSAKEAKKGMKDNKYYMVVTLPKDFSKNAATVLEDTPKKMNIKYETNGGLNYLGEVVGENAIKQLKSEVGETVTKEYASTIISLVKEIGTGMQTAADGSQKLSDGTTQLASGNEEITANLKKLAASTVTFSDGTNTLKVGLDQYVDGVSQVNSGAQQLDSGVSQLTAQLPALTSGVSTLNSGATSLKNGVSTYTDGADQLSDGTIQLVNQLQSSLTQLNKQVDPTQLQAAITTISDMKKSNQLEEMNQLLTEANTALAKVPDSQTILQQYQAIGTEVANLKTELNTQLAQFNAALAAIQSYDDTVTQNATESIESLSTNTALADVEKTSVYEELTDEQKATLASELGATNSNAEVIEKQKAILTAAGTNKTYAENLATAVGSIGTEMNGKIDELVSQLPTTETVTQLTGMIDKLKVEIPTAQTSLTSANTMLNGIDTNKLNSLVEQLSTLSSTELTNSLNSLKSGATQLEESSSKLNSGASRLASGTSTLNSSVPALTAGVSQLKTGTTTLASGTKKLNDNGSALTSGASQLLSGSTQIASGSGQLATGSQTLGAGLTTLQSGSDEMAAKLAKAAGSVTGLSLTNKTSSMIAAPDKTTQKKYSDVPNYGHALAPYFLSVSLFVGCLVFNFVYPIRKIADRNGTSAGWFLSKVSIGFIVATVMALAAGAIMMALGLSVNNPTEYFAMLLISAYCSMFLIMFLAMSFDNPGRFIAMILLVLQLGAAGGVFPMPIISKFYNTVHPYIPMTYSIYGLREAISSGLGTSTFVHSFFVLFMIVAACLVLLYLAMYLLKKHHKEGYSQLNGNQNLLDNNYDYSKEKYSLW